MRIIDLFISGGCSQWPQVLIQAATERGRQWLLLLGRGKLMMDAILIQTEEEIAEALALIPEDFETITM